MYMYLLKFLLSTLELTDENTIKNNFVSLYAAALQVDIIVDI